MRFEDLISPDRVACGVRASSKKRVLEQLSELIVAREPGISPAEVFESLVARERLGSTALGKGVAIPHGRLKTGGQTLLAFMRLEEGVDFDAPDGSPVDLLCALIVPPESTEEHLQILAKLSEMFGDEALRGELRKAENAESLYRLLVDWAVAKDR